MQSVEDNIGTGGLKARNDVEAGIDLGHFISRCPQGRCAFTPR
jgi:hypothetical protein